MERMKYVKVGKYNSIIIFPSIIQHSEFRCFKPKTAGFCFISEDKVECFGNSISLGLKAGEYEDTILATKQYCGVDAMLKLDELITTKKIILMR